MVVDQLPGDMVRIRVYDYTLTADFTLSTGWARKLALALAPDLR